MAPRLVALAIFGGQSKAQTAQDGDGGCNKGYTKECRLKEHKRSHTGERPFVCETCQASFIRDTHLVAHLRSHRPEQDKPFQCTLPDCDKRFWTRQHLNNHVKTKHECPMLQCQECPLQFAKDHLLRTHMAQVHSPPGTLPFQCDHQGCSKSFSTGSKLRSHKKTHDKNRYVCAHASCLEQPDGPPHFANWTQLQKHNKTAHAPRCPLVDCQDMTFKSHKALLHHMAMEHGQDLDGNPVQVLKKRKRKAPKIESETDLTSEAEPHASSSKTIACPNDGCTFAARKQKALDRHLAHAHPAPRNLALEFLTGHNYALAAPDDLSGPERKRRKLDRKHPCPKSTDGCQYVFKRVYDVERHLAAVHDVVMGRDDLTALLAAGA